MVAETELLVIINGSAEKVLKEFDRLNKKSKATQKVLKNVAKFSALAFTGLVATVAVVTKSYADYETALVGVGKTTDLTGQKLRTFGKEFQKLSKTIPVSTNDLLGLAQAGGQLGVKTKDLVKFTTTIAKLGVATDLTGEQAATGLTRILNVTNEGIDTIDTFASVIVALGNNFAATESEIVRMTNEVARSTTVFGVSAAEAAALGTAMRSVGVQAQLGGSVVGKSLLKIQKAINDGGKEFQLLEKLTGLTGDTLKQTFDTDATQVFQKFLGGLNNLEGGTSAMFTALESLGLRGDEVNKVLPVLAKNTELVARAMKVAGKETKNATALNKEAEAAFKTLNSNITRTKNTLNVMTTVIGEKLAPTINDLLDTIQSVANGISELDDETIASLGTFLKWITGITGALAAAFAFALGAIKVSAAITAIATLFGGATIAAGSFWAVALGPITVAIVGIVAVGAAIAGVIAIMSGDNKPRTLENITSELEKIRKKREEIANQPDVGFVKNAKQLKDIDDQIKKLEDMRQAKIRASEDFGTGKLLLRPETEDVNLGADAFGLPETRTFPFKAEEDIQADDASREKLETQKAINLKIAEDAKKNSQALADIERQKNAVIAAENRRASEEEIEIIKQKEVVKKSQVEASLEEDKIVKAALEERTAIHQTRLRELETNYEAGRLERKRVNAAQERELDIAAKEAGIDLNTEYNEIEREQLEENIITKDEVLAAERDKNLQFEIDRRNQFIEDETKHGIAFAKIRNTLNSQEVTQAKNTADSLVQLTNSKNSTLKGIGKAAALVQIGINTARGALDAYSALAGIPVVGPALGIAAAGALTLYGAERAAQVTGAQGGALVTGGTKGIDSELFALGKGELVAPDKSFDEVVEGTARSRGFVNPEEEGSTGGGQMITVVLEPKDDLINFIEQKIIEAQIQNTGVA